MDTKRQEIIWGEERCKQKAVRKFQTAGYGYAVYRNQSGYDVSAVSYERMMELAKANDGWTGTLFVEQGGTILHVYAFAMQAPNQAVQARRPTARLTLATELRQKPGP